ncbi:CAP domain-containing protein, partial [Kingella oralis]
MPYVWQSQIAQRQRPTYRFILRPHKPHPKRQPENPCQPPPPRFSGCLPPTMKKSRTQRPQSPLIRRLLYFWLPLAALLLGMGYFSQARYNPAKEAKAGLDRLNYWRTQAGLQPLAPNPQLQKAAQNHANYLSRHPEGHNETQRSHPS